MNTANQSRAARSKFDFDLLRGELAQDSFARMLVKGRFEVKVDDYCCGRNGRRRTGNIALEYKQRHSDGVVRPSGVHPESTSADWLAVEFHDGCWLTLPMAVAQDLVRRSELDERRWVGDGSNHLNALVPVTRLFEL